MKRKLFITLAFLLAVGLLAGAALAQGGGYDLSWFTVDGGGGHSAGNAYTLDGTLGQPDAGELAGGGYTLTGGFWGGSAFQARLYLPLVRR